MRSISARLASGVAIAVVYCACACAPLLAVTPRIAKLGLVAPFEGRNRAIGYDALYAARLAIRDDRGRQSTTRIELLALDSGANSDALHRQARALAVDPDVLFVIVVIAPEDETLARAAYTVLSPPVRYVRVAATAPATDDAFARRYAEISGGAPPGVVAAAVYEAATTVLSPSTVVR
ncbi:MAG: hypothetical protein HZB53_17200 [Chloroflexi bacterium]|nr:hypothetical protein [Chloroflexota bacterium]